MAEPAVFGATEPIVASVNDVANVEFHETSAGEPRTTVEGCAVTVQEGGGSVTVTDVCAYVAHAL